MAITEGAADTSDLLLETEHFVIESSQFLKHFLKIIVFGKWYLKRHKKYQEINSLKTCVVLVWYLCAMITKSAY